MTAVKFCGMRRVRDIEYANECRPDYAGFILSDGFGRSVDPGTFYELLTYLDKDIKRAGVFVDEPIENILHCAYTDALDVIQLHGNEDEEYINRLREHFSGEVWKAVRAKRPEDIENAERLPCDKLVIDSFSEAAVGGTGKRIDTGVVMSAKITKPFFIAGGITPENVRGIADLVHPFGVDVSSGIETDGVKDLNKMKIVVSNIRKELSR